MNSNGRDRRGRFAPGNSGGPGRLPVKREHEYCETLVTVCTVADWRAICRRAVKDAKAGDRHAREWLAKYLVGQPSEKVLHAHLHAHENVEEENPWLNVSNETVIKAKSMLARLLEEDQGRRLQYDGDQGSRE